MLDDWRIALSPNLQQMPLVKGMLPKSYMPNAVSHDDKLQQCGQTSLQGTCSYLRGGGPIVLSGNSEGRIAELTVVVQTKW